MKKLLLSIITCSVFASAYATEGKTSHFFNKDGEEVNVNIGNGTISLAFGETSILIENEGVNIKESNSETKIGFPLSVNIPTEEHCIEEFCSLDSFLNYNGNFIKFKTASGIDLTISTKDRELKIEQSKGTDQLASFTIPFKSIQEKSIKNFGKMLDERFQRNLYSQPDPTIESLKAEIDSKNAQIESLKGHISILENLIYSKDNKIQNSINKLLDHRYQDVPFSAIQAPK